MSLITVLLVLIAVGVILWLVNTYIPMDANIKKIINIIAIILVVIWLLEALGIIPLLSSVKI